jgi:pentatricopeptide repeat domain-containing protein 1
MKLNGSSPDVVIYSSLIDGCTKDNRLDQALDFFAEMKLNGLSPNVVTYNSMIDGCAIDKYLAQALQLLTNNYFEKRTFSMDMLMNTT